MTVKKLVDYLTELMEEDSAVENLTVVMSKDAEGNSYSKLDEIGKGHVVEDDIFFDFIEQEEDWEEGGYPGDNCVVFWPL